MSKRTFNPAVHCGGTTRAKTPCTNGKGQGTEHPGYGYCEMHTGSTPNGNKHAETERRTLEQVRIEGQIASLLDAEAASLEGRDALEALAEILRKQWAWERLCWLMLSERSPDGLYGPDHNGDGRPDVLVSMHRDAARDVAVTAKLAKDAGLQERWIELAEEDSRRFVDALVMVVDALLSELTGRKVTAAVAASVRRDALPGLVQQAIETTGRAA